MYTIMHCLQGYCAACRYHHHGHSNGSSEQCLAQLLLFGSFCSGLWHKGSDLDLTLTGRWRNRHGQLLCVVRQEPLAPLGSVGFARH
jgi:hypothetical protein